MTSPRASALGHSQSLGGILGQCYLCAVRGRSRAASVTPVSPALFLSAKTLPPSEVTGTVRAHLSPPPFPASRPTETAGGKVRPKESPLEGGRSSGGGAHPGPLTCGGTRQVKGRRAAPIPAFLGQVLLPSEWLGFHLNRSPDCVPRDPIPHTPPILATGAVFHHCGIFCTGRQIQGTHAQVIFPSSFVTGQVAV